MSEKKDLKLRIKEAIEAFGTGDLSDSALHLLKTLGYSAPRLNYFTRGSFAEFEDTFGKNNTRVNKKNAQHEQWKQVDLLFQLTGDNLGAQQGMFQNERVDNTIIESYLFFALELKPKKEGSYTRTDLSQITREVNKCFAMPAMILFKHESTLSFAVIDRRLHKRESSKDVLEKVTLIKDIRTSATHRAHIEILFDLSLEQLRKKHEVPNFPKLHEAWRQTLDTKELNKKFFRELSNWYFHAVEVTRWPDDEEKDRDKRNAINTIRLITRLMFVWFLREKDLVPDALFDREALGLGGKGGSGGKGGRATILKGDTKEKSLYYKAILQNLFFATLNTEMGEKRRFRIEADRSQSKHYFIHNVFRYERCFTDPKAMLKDVFAPIPFLNGGLFECLDKQVEQKGKLVPVRIDGFSDREDNPLFVPDKLFFDPEGEEWDFSEVYGSKKARKEKVRGLIDILGSYKFTITENTPIEEEVALDPELLGKVFENLLANYNPETKTTARKQTGSFYTPREIVNYMVDESLIAYLKTALGAKVDAEESLRHLLSYTEEKHRFTPKETETLIAAIDNCKILDPACGSGAFPMGVLHKLVHVLHKLDPKNTQWKERQIEKAAQLDDAEIRERTIADIEDAFEHNALDYGRKLYLIENGIYGVDIQPIAMQIAKLRFFISLVVDQRVDAKRTNLGVRPLPNLETKFVAANTLMKLEKEQDNLFTNPAIDRKKAQLKRVRHDYFEARTPQRKAKCREQDKQLREELAELLVGEHELQPRTAKMLAAWDPYDQNASAPFFDPEWMFGLSGGFDVVIGNPPYVDIKGLDKALAKDLFARFATARNRINLYSFFIEASHGLLGNRGALAFIIPNSLLVGESYTLVRKLLMPDVTALVKLPDGVFEAVVETMLLFAVKGTAGDTVHGKHFDHDAAIDFERIDFQSFSRMKWSGDDEWRFNIFSTKRELELCEKIAAGSKALSDFAEFTLGITPYDKYKGHSERLIQSRGFHADKKLSKEYVPLIDGSNILPFVVDPTVREWLRYGPWLGAPREERFFIKPRIIVRQIASGSPLRIYAGYTDKRLYHTQIGFSILALADADISVFFLLGLINSTLLNFYHSEVFLDQEKNTFQKVLIANCKKLPVRKPPAKVKAQLEQLVEKRLGLAAGPWAEAVEREIDQVVYGLYGLTEEEIRIVEGSVKRKGGEQGRATENEDQ